MTAVCVDIALFCLGTDWGTTATTRKRCKVDKEDGAAAPTPSSTTAAVPVSGALSVASSGSAAATLADADTLPADGSLLRQESMLCHSGSFDDKSVAATVIKA